MSTKAGGRRLGAVLIASAVLASGCAIDPDQLPGVYRNDATGGEIVLESDGTFSATDVRTDGSSGPHDFSGRWEFLDRQESSDCIYLSIDDGGLGRTSGVQLYASGQEEVYFRHDPDGPPTSVLTRVAAP
ncbi:hypothetical protein [Streptomonospora wellingtoniae]|uniref:Secreted protein n=1 Tax=Streptomonospora wellingtoniae TaxID=3075544 RepID=A0ABU2KTX1_9ACTN|nr:hypothetical protein [Streptomonospora sp. DSM 45055]MDT0302747.1 hypothetical protein [Streptomonospora sp. DSM 45055]